MTIVKDILNFIEALAPRYMAEDWDNVGLLCGHSCKEVRKILVALDPFQHVCQEAVQWEADLLVTHHPLIFSPLKTLTDSSEVGRSLMTLIKADISAINAHTNLDLAPGGVNDVLAEKLGLENVRPISPVGTDAEGRPYGLLHMGEVEEISLAAFLASVKDALGTPVLRYADGGKKVRKVAVGGGACGGGLLEAAAAGCDTFVTADIKYNQFWDAKVLGLNLIDGGHFHTENPVVPVLAGKIAAAFPEVQVKISESHADCMKFF